MRLDSFDATNPKNIIFIEQFCRFHIFRSKTINLEKLKLRLLHDVDSFDNESKSLSEYRREMELLQQEKMAHVEELRQIHADINAMETVIKQVLNLRAYISFMNSVVQKTIGERMSFEH